MADSEIRVKVIAEGLAQLIGDKERLLRLQKLSNNLIGAQSRKLNDLSESAFDANTIINDISTKLGGLAAAAYLAQPVVLTAIAVIGTFTSAYAATSHLMKSTGAEDALSKALGLKDLSKLEAAEKKVGALKTAVARYQRVIDKNKDPNSKSLYKQQLDRSTKALKRAEAARDRIKKHDLDGTIKTEATKTEAVKTGVADRTAVLEKAVDNETEATLKRVKVEQEAAAKKAANEKELADYIAFVNADAYGKLELTYEKDLKAAGDNVLKKYQAWEKYTDAVIKLNDKQGKTIVESSGKTNNDQLDNYTTTTNEMSALSQNFATQTETWLADSIVNMELDLDGLVKYFERSLARMVANAATQQIMLSLGLNVPGGGAGFASLFGAGGSAVAADATATTAAGYTAGSGVGAGYVTAGGAGAGAIAAAVAPYAFAAVAAYMITDGFGTQRKDTAPQTLYGAKDAGKDPIGSFFTNLSKFTDYFASGKFYEAGFNLTQISDTTDRFKPQAGLNTTAGAAWEGFAHMAGQIGQAMEDASLKGISFQTALQNILQSATDVDPALQRLADTIGTDTGAALDTLGNKAIDFAMTAAFSGEAASGLTQAAITMAKQLKKDELAVYDNVTALGSFVDQMAGINDQTRGLDHVGNMQSTVDKLFTKFANVLDTKQLTDLRNYEDQLKAIEEERKRLNEDIRTGKDANGNRLTDQQITDRQDRLDSLNTTSENIAKALGDLLTAANINTGTDANGNATTDQPTASKMLWPENAPTTTQYETLNAGITGLTTPITDLTTALSDANTNNVDPELLSATTVLDKSMLTLTGVITGNETAGNIIAGADGATASVDTLAGAIDSLPSEKTIDIYINEHRGSSGGGTGGSDGGKLVPLGAAFGLEHVPYDNYLANLHSGESVLSYIKGDAQLYRGLAQNGIWNRMKEGYMPVSNVPVPVGGDGATIGSTPVSLSIPVQIDLDGEPLARKVIDVSLALSREGVTVVSSAGVEAVRR